MNIVRRQTLVNLTQGLMDALRHHSHEEEEIRAEFNKLQEHMDRYIPKEEEDEATQVPDSALSTEDLRQRLLVEALEKWTKDARDGMFECTMLLGYTEKGYPRRQVTGTDEMRKKLEELATADILSLQLHRFSPTDSGTSRDDKDE